MSIGPSPLTVTGTPYRDVLFGGNGNDIIAGGDCDDDIVGGAGNDRIIGGDGWDTLRGGAGNDTFIYNTRGFDADTIADFDTNVDKIDLSYLNIPNFDILQPFMVQDGTNVVIAFGPIYTAS